MPGEGVSASSQRVRMGCRTAWVRARMVKSDQVPPPSREGPGSHPRSAPAWWAGRAPRAATPARVSGGPGPPNGPGPVPWPGGRPGAPRALASCLSRGRRMSRCTTAGGDRGSPGRPGATDRGCPAPGIPRASGQGPGRAASADRGRVGCVLASVALPGKPPAPRAPSVGQNPPGAERSDRPSGPRSCGSYHWGRAPDPAGDSGRVRRRG